MTISQEGGDSDLSETAKVIVEYDPESAILQESNAFDSELEGLYLDEPNTAAKYRRPNRGARRFKIARIDDIEDLA